MQRKGTVKCGTYLDTYMVLSFVTGFITVSFPLYVFYLSPVEMLSLDPFQEKTHLMCYFHVVKNCKEKLCSYAKDLQQDILHDVQQLHGSVSSQECNAVMTKFIPKWTELVPDFLTYFLNQWMASDSFGSWRVYCSAPGKAVL